MHHACTASALLCTTWAGQGSMELALAVAADSTWPVHVRRSALLLVSVLCRGSSEAAHHFRQLEVSALFHFLIFSGHLIVLASKVRLLMCLNQQEDNFLHGGVKSSVLDDRSVVPAFTAVRQQLFAPVWQNSVVQRLTAAGSGMSVPGARETQADGE